MYVGSDPEHIHDTNRQLSASALRLLCFAYRTGPLCTPAAVGYAACRLQRSIQQLLHSDAHTCCAPVTTHAPLRG